VCDLEDHPKSQQSKRMERHGIISGKGLLPYLGLTLGIGAVALAVIRVGYMAGAALGCLPILLQIPVFFALYATLDGAVELRQVSFLWAKDLAAADTVLTIPLYFFNLPINPLVLIMTGLMVVQQHMTPMSLDPMQKKMMLAMPIIMLLFLYDLPSGLTLYWSVSNFFSIIQMRLQRRHYNDQGATPAEASGKERPAAAPGRASRSGTGCRSRAFRSVTAFG